VDAVAGQDTAAGVQVIVVDDASADGTAGIAAGHPAVDIAVRLAEHAGSAAARNVASYLADGDFLVFLDADMVLPGHVLADIAARVRDDAVLTGFRHNIAYVPGTADRPAVPAGEPLLEADHRVRWHPPIGVPMFYSGQVYDEALDGRPLDHTRDFIDLGHGRTYYDWDLPRMLVTALAAAPRQAVCDAGGFHPAFGADGWGCEDTHLGAALIARGCKFIPMRQARGWHIDPPDAEQAWQAKYASAPERIRLLRRLLQRPAGERGPADLASQCQALIRTAERLR